MVAGVAVLLLPFFLAACILQVGNASNDNRMLGKHLGTRDEWSVRLLPSMLYQGTKGLVRTIWTHGGPTSSFVHVVSSFCLLLPQTLMEAVLIKYGFISQGNLPILEFTVVTCEGKFGRECSYLLWTLWLFIAIHLPSVPSLPMLPPHDGEWNLIWCDWVSVARVGMNVEREQELWYEDIM